MKEITINWHILEACNYSCHYCFAKYQESDRRELHYSKSKINLFLKYVYDFFSKKYDLVRLNIAGGEPTLSSHLDYIIKKAYGFGFKVSIITNGSCLNDDFILKSVPYLSMFAISVDSLDPEINKKIGRVVKGKTLSPVQLIQSLKEVRDKNKNILIKINTVVNTYNCDEDMSVFY
nr:viperin family antiviral radical SAM protein [Sulfurimonas sp. MAG313]